MLGFGGREALSELQRAASAVGQDKGVAEEKEGQIEDSTEHGGGGAQLGATSEHVDLKSSLEAEVPSVMQTNLGKLLLKALQEVGVEEIGDVAALTVEERNKMLEDIEIPANKKKKRDARKLKSGEKARLRRAMQSLDSPPLREKRGERPKGNMKTAEEDRNPEELSRALSAMAAFSAGDTELAKQVLLEQKAKAEEDQERLAIKAKYGNPNPQHFPEAACQRNMAVGWKAKRLIVTEPTVDLAAGKITWRHLVQR